MLPPWLLLLGTIAFEVAGTISMKLSYGFTRLVPTLMIVVCYGISFSLFTLALRNMEVSTVYALWAGLGTSLVAIIGIVYFKEAINLPKVLGIGFVVLGVILINLNNPRP